jgi:uncharacterized OB-fold protein
VSERPQPVIDDESHPFWDAARERRLAIQRCRACNEYVFPPRALCPTCHDAALEWVDATGTGSVYSYTVARRPAGASFADKVPYVVAIVELDEGVRMLSNVVGVEVDAVRVGQRVQVTFEESGEVTLPMFEPAE